MDIGQRLDHLDHLDPPRPASLVAPRCTLMGICQLGLKFRVSRRVVPPGPFSIRARDVYKATVADWSGPRGDAPRCSAVTSRPMKPSTRA